MLPLLVIGAVLLYFATRETEYMVDKAKTGGAVLHIERLKGVLPELQSVILSWNGPFNILIAPEGGLRTDAAKQLAYYNAGNSKAKTLEETPHGRGAAIDVWPEGFDPTKSLDLQPTIRSQFIFIREWALSKGLVLIGTPDVTWDYPHLQLQYWKRYPYPPSKGISS